MNLFGTDGAQTAAGDAGEADGVGGELRVGAAETLRGVHGAETAAGVSEHEGHDGQRVRMNISQDVWCCLGFKLNGFSLSAL